MKNKQLIYCVIIMINILIVSSCRGTEPTRLVDNITQKETTENIVAPTSEKVIKDKAEIILSMRIPKTLNPILNADVSVDRILKLIFEPITVLDENLKPIPNDNLVKNITFSTDGSSVIIDLHENKYWSDGVQITADDLLFTIDTIKLSPENSFYKSRVQNILSREPISEFSLQINFNANVLKVPFNFDFPIIPKHYYEADLIENSEKNMHPIGNGNYKFENYTEVKELNLISDNTNNKEKRYITKIKILIIRDELTDYYAFDQTIIDAVTGSVSEWGKYLNSKDYNSVEFISNYYDFVGFNFNNPTLIKKAVREAIYYSTDWNNIVDSVYIDYAKRTLSPVNPTSWVYNKELVDIEVDTSKAKKLIADNTDDTQRTFNILVNVENEPRNKIANTIKKNLESIGLTINIISLPFEEYSLKLNAREYDMFIGGFNIPKDGNLSFAFHSSNAGVGQNYFDYRSEAIDSLLFNVTNSIDETSYAIAMNNLQKEIAQELPVISIAFRKSSVILDKSISGNIKPTIDNGYGNIYEWTIINNLN